MLMDRPTGPAVGAALLRMPGRASQRPGHVRLGSRGAQMGLRGSHAATKPFDCKGKLLFHGLVCTGLHFKDPVQHHRLWLSSHTDKILETFKCFYLITPLDECLKHPVSHKIK